VKKRRGQQQSVCLLQVESALLDGDVVEVGLVVVLVLAPVDGAELEHLVAAADAGRAALDGRARRRVGVDGLDDLRARVRGRGGGGQGEEAGERLGVGERHCEGKVG
jgi:hypothetical protein